MADPISHVVTIDLLDANNENADSIAVPSTTTKFSKSFFWPNGTDFSVSYRFTSANGSVDITLSIESSDVAPTTENAADLVNYAVGNTIASNVSAETLQIAAPAPAVGKKVRFKFVGAGSNNADAVCDILKLHFTVRS